MENRERRWCWSPWRVLLGMIDGVGIGLILLACTVIFYNGSVPPIIWNNLKASILLAVPLLIGSNYIGGLYNHIWDFASIETVCAIACSVTFSQFAAFVLARCCFGPLPSLVWITTWLGALLWVGFPRMLWRLIRPNLKTKDNGTNGNGSPCRVLIYGAGHHGYTLMRHLKQHRTVYELVGFVDDDPYKQGAFVGRSKVLGMGRDLPALIRKHQVDEVILAIPSADNHTIRRIYEYCRQEKVKISVLSNILESIEEPFSRRIRPIRIEDFLGRSFSFHDIKLHSNYIEGKTVLITGAGGSIGQELATQVCRYHPQRVILIGRGENRIHWALFHLGNKYPQIEIIPIIANVTVQSTMEAVLSAYRPHIIFHAAAHKHVYLMEFVPVEAVRNNVLGTANLAALAEKYGVEKFVFISTDKAASPVNVMGATKRYCELILSLRPYMGTEFISVRFGNVLGSEGSVLEIFKRQWANRQPLTVTDPQATRYFMSIPEACFLVLQAGAIGKHGEIFLLKMGDPVRILDLAKMFILLQGGDPNAPGAIEIQSLRPGERTNETLTNPHEILEPTKDENILRVENTRGALSWPELTENLDELRMAVDTEDAERVCFQLAYITGATLNPSNCLVNKQNISEKTQ